MERDDLIVNDQYSLDAHHSEEKGKQIRKNIIRVTIILTLITTAEVVMGVFIKQGTTIWPFVKWAFIIMTLVKAAYIVAVFMHLGDERKSFRYVILIPYLIFISYLIFVGIQESNALNYIWSNY